MQQKHWMHWNFLDFKEPNKLEGDIGRHLINERLTMSVVLAYSPKALRQKRTTNCAKKKQTSFKPVSKSLSPGKRNIALQEKVSFSGCIFAGSKCGHHHENLPSSEGAAWQLLQTFNELMVAMKKQLYNYKLYTEKTGSLLRLLLSQNLIWTLPIAKYL